MTALEFIQSRAAAFALAPNINELLSQAEGETSESYPTSDLRNKAIGLLVCHWLALDRRDSSGVGNAGTISHEKEGQLSRSYTVANSYNQNVELDPDLSQTRWGMELIQHRKKCFFFPITRMM